MNRSSIAVFGLILAFVVPTLSASAQPWRAGGTLYGKVGGGISEYTGDYSPSGVPYRLGHFGEGGFPYVLRGEVGYQVIPELAIAAGAEMGNYPFADRSAQLDDARRSALQLLVRYTHRPQAWRAAPYVDVGRVLTFGGVRGGHGVSIGIGVDYALTRRLALNVEARGNTLWPDNAMDGRGIGVEGVDQLSQLLGVGIKYNLRAAPVPPRFVTIAGSTRVEVGKTVTYTASADEEATRPLQRTWTIGESPAGRSQTVRHTFAEPGTYTVAIAVENEAGTARDSLPVTVVPPPTPPAIAEIGATPRPAKTGQRVQFTGRADGDDPLAYEWQFGDGASATGSSPAHAYEEAGTYTVGLTAKNEAGRDTRRLTLSVQPRRAPLSGTVTHAETGNPLLNTRVRAVPVPDTLETVPAEVDTSAIRARADSMGVSVKSSAGGAFALTGVPVGSILLWGTKAGFEPTLKPVDHAGGDTTEVTLSLVPGKETAASIERDLARTGRRVLENVHFAFDSAAIEEGEDGAATLRAVLEVVQDRMAGKDFLIEGHTDSKGAEAYNKGLSKRRARSVVEWLVNNGVDPSRLTARGQGETEPIASNETKEGRRENRRTEIIMVE